MSIRNTYQAFKTQDPSKMTQKRTEWILNFRYFIFGLLFVSKQSVEMWPRWTALKRFSNSSNSSICGEGNNKATSKQMRSGQHEHHRHRKHSQFR